MREYDQPLPARSRRPRLFIACLLLSLLLHLLLVWKLPDYIPQTKPGPTEPTFVTLQEHPENTKKPPQLELDETPQPDQERPETADRIAVANQQVPIEMAPAGEDSRDQKSAKTVQSPKMPPSQASRQTTAADSAKEVKSTAGELQMSKREMPALTTKPLQQLTRLAPDTLSRIAREEQRERVKKRDDLLEGDEIYLNLQHDYLISFFKRFSNRIEAVWNYPVEAAKRGEEGVLLLKITVDRGGELIDVDLQASSGSDDLDFEAIQAIYRAAPFGPITSHWPHEQMKIYAHFQYTLTNRYIYGR